MPDENEAKEIAKRIDKYDGFPQVMGMIDGSHIPLKAPKESYADYVNRKGWTSVNLQPVVESET